MRIVIAAMVALSARAAPAVADDLEPCADAILDPIATPLRDAALDAQRGACLRDELRIDALATALIDNPGFHGVLAGDLRFAGRTRVGARFELDVGVRALRAAFAQTAVNKVTDVTLGPVTVGGMYSVPLGVGAQLALAAHLELPYTRDDVDTLHVATDAGAAVTARLTRRTFLHARLGAIAAHASSAGGSTNRLALRAGTDLVREIRGRLTLHAGADVAAGWYVGLDHVLVRAGVQVRFGRRWRGVAGFGVPVAGDERTTLVVDLGIARDLR